MAAILSASRWPTAVVAAAWAFLAVPVAHAEPLAYVPLSGAAQVQLIDTRDGTTVRHIPVAAGPIGIAVDAARGKVYLAHQASPRLSRIDMTTRQRDGELILPSDAWGIALSPDGARAYVALSGSDQLAIVDTANLSLLASVPTGSTPRDVVVSADGSRVFVSNQFGGSLTVVDTDSQTAVGSFALCSAPLGLALRAGGNLLYAVCAFDDKLVRFDTTSYSVVGTTSTGDGPSAVLVNADGSRIYVSSTAGDQVTVIDGGSHAVQQQIAVGAGPYGLSLSDDGARLYVSNVHSNSISVIDTVNNSVLTSYPLAAGAFAVGQMLAPATAPDPPVIATVSAGDGNAILELAPSFDGGSAISDYSARCDPGAISVEASSASIAIPDLTNNRVYRCTVRARNNVGTSSPSASRSLIPGTSGTSADLAISKSNTADFIAGGSRVSYRITVGNPGPAAVAGARLTDQLENGFSDTQWVCSGSGGAECAANGQGDLDLQLDLPIGSSVQVDINAVLAALPETPVFNMAAVALPAAMSDPDLGNNVAVDGPDVRGLFRDGFE